jgi:tetratricopeptide (TPR) repeat protein
MTATACSRCGTVVRPCLEYIRRRTRAFSGLNRASSEWMYWHGHMQQGDPMNSEPAFDHLVAEGLAASQDNRAEDAIALFRRASTLAPASAVPHFLIGSEQASLGHVDAAEAALADAVRLEPGFAVARYQLGLLQFSSQRAALAMLTWQPLLALPGSDPLGHFVRGFAALAHDDFGTALAHYGQGLACNEGNQALGADIQRVMEAVRRLHAREGGAEPDAAGQHVLLSGYSGKLH